MTSRPSPPRWIVVDDGDPSITYTGPGWSQDNSGSKDSIKNFGPTYMHTLHQTSVNGTMSFEFNGTAVVAWGTSIAPGPNFECFVDDLSIGRNPSPSFDQNNFNLCTKTGLLEGHHTFRIDVKAQPQNESFYLDRIRYIPSADVSLEGKTIKLQNDDPAVRLDAHWKPLDGSIVKVTSQTNSSARVDFVGSSISWVAAIPREFPHNPSMGAWSLDGGEQNPFLLPGLSPDQNETQFQTFYFTTPEVETGPHTLTVTFLGSDQTTPLCLDYLYINNGTVQTSSAISSALPTPTSSANPDGGKSGAPKVNSRIGGIIGGVIGGLAFLLIVAAVYLFWWRRRARGRQGEYSPRSFGSPIIGGHDQSWLSIEGSRVAVTVASQVRSPVGKQQTITRSSPPTPPHVDTEARSSFHNAPPRYTAINPFGN